MRITEVAAFCKAAADKCSTCLAVSARAEDLCKDATHLVVQFLVIMDRCRVRACKIVAFAVAVATSQL